MTAQMFLDMVGAHAAKRFRKGVLPFADLFCGGGGTAVGTIIAFKELGLSFQLCAVNHWDTAIATHELNHEGHLHFCSGVDKIDIDYLLSESDSDGLFGLWGSPSCVAHSQARGGVPINDQSRSGCYVLVQWLRRKRAVHMWVENVPAFLNYGPVKQKTDKAGIPLFLKKNAKGQWKECYAPGLVRPKGVPAKRWWKTVEAELGLKPAMIADPEYRGVYFLKWVREIRKLGYDIDWRILNAADWGAATNRERLIIQAVKRGTGRKIVWPNPTHAAPGEGGAIPSGLLPHNTTRKKVIDWTDAGKSIFERKKSLADKSIDRIAVGVFRFGFDGAAIKFKGTGTANSLDTPLGAVQANGNHYGLARPEKVSVILPQQRGRKDELRVKSVDVPMPTIAGSGADAIATAEFLIPNFGERPTQTPRTHSLDETLPCITSHGAGGLVSAKLNPSVITISHGNSKKEKDPNWRRARSVDTPLDNVTGSNDFGVANSTAISAVGTDEVPVLIKTWRDLSAAIKAGVKRAKKEPGYRPLISFRGCVFRLEVLFRMLKWRELARAQSFPDLYKFTGTDTDRVKMIGNAVPPALARAVVKAAVSQNPDVGVWLETQAPPAAMVMAC